jgi:hypothetical protein
MTRVRAAQQWVPACLLVLVSTGCGISRPVDPDSARGHAEALKRALVQADGAALVGLVEDPSYAVSTALLTDAVLGQGALAGQDVEIKRTDRDLETIRYALRVPDDEPRPWLEVQLRRSGDFVGLPLPSVTLDGPGVNAVRIGGKTARIDPLPREGQAFYLPPGEYDVGAAGAERYVDHGPTQHVDTRSYRPDRLEFTGDLTAAGRRRVDRSVKAYVRRCTELLRGNRPSNCPARVAFVGGLDSSEWTLASYPRITIEANGDGWSVSTPEPPVARMKRTVQDRRTGVTERVTDTVPFAVNGRIAVRGDELVVDIPDY